MKVLRSLTIVSLLLSGLLWFLLAPRYATPNHSIVYLLFVGFLAMPVMLLLGLVPAALFALIPFRQKTYFEKLKVLTMVFTSLFSFVFCFVVAAILLSL